MNSVEVIREYVLMDGLDDWVGIMHLLDAEAFQLPAETDMLSIVLQVVGDLKEQGLVEIGIPQESGFEPWPLTTEQCLSHLASILFSDDPGYDGYATYLRITELGEVEASKILASRTRDSHGSCC